MKSFKLTRQEMDEIASRHPTPFMVLSLAKVEENYRFMRKHMPKAGIYYAMKANPSKAVLRKMAALGANFDVASGGEIEMLHELGIDASRMIYANTVKDFQGLETARRVGLRRFTFDDRTEIAKIAAYVPGADVLVRISVANDKALVDLNTKFGTHPEQALELLEAAKQAGLHPIGICFHVGSQSLSTAAYEEALLLCRGLFREAERRGMRLTDLDIGGGFPVPSADGLSVDLAQMMEAINRHAERLFPDVDVWCEPGRYMCGTAVNLVASVIGTKDRADSRWYILDEGIYGAFSGIMYDHWTYPLYCFGKGKKCRSTFAGPSCDGIDVLYKDVMAPRMEIGDRILVSDIGSYASVSATRFNGFRIAPTLVYEEEVEQASAGLPADREAV
ncbi:MAG: type III PLP-dependent enzyme [Selenomonadaceae bacterium]|nr:type III PLP-dependent enzyme [Selenomonadaceae bacterium]